MKISNFQIPISNERGFTLVELIVAVGLFLAVTAIAVGGFVRALRTERQVASFVSAQTSVSQALEQMAREVRTGSNFCSGGNPCPGPSELVFTNANGQTVDYRLNSAALERGVGGAFQQLTDESASIQYLNFVETGNQSGGPPRITISVGISPQENGASGTVVRLQTTVSARVFEKITYGQASYEASYYTQGSYQGSYYTQGSYQGSYYTQGYYQGYYYTEGSYGGGCTREFGTCNVDGDCCSPLTCQSNAPGPGSTCHPPPYTQGGYGYSEGGYLCGGGIPYCEGYYQGYYQGYYESGYVGESYYEGSYK